jgi:hypothetical protein
VNIDVKGQICSVEYLGQPGRYTITYKGKQLKTYPSPDPECPVIITHRDFFAVKLYDMGGRLELRQ